jgi:sigma-B regulation protein RsbU (phosphoserine phosphatase)
MIKPEESLFFYTDGVTEAINENEEEFQEERLIECLKHIQNMEANNFVNTVISCVQNFTKNFEQSDDITCLSVKYCKNKLLNS